MADEKALNSSIVSKQVEKLEKDQFKMPTYIALIGLVVAFIILKSAIYIKDKKRHGK